MRGGSGGRPEKSWLPVTHEAHDGCRDQRGGGSDEPRHRDEMRGQGTREYESEHQRRYPGDQPMKVPSRLIVFPDENHWIQKGENSRLFYSELAAWLARWLGPPAPG